ncbi:MAG: 4Fe-4S dicluster domain-containing protein [Nitrososphaerales archaeon]|jgi:anaerobic dimethyl sulfoxide reductase subunit B
MSSTTSTTTTTTTVSFPTWTPSWQTGVQYGFFFDQSRCVSCFNCQLLCKSKLGVGPGAVRPARMFVWETGTFPTVRVNTLFAPCYHCENPVCVPLANGALIKEPNFGAVILDPELAGDANYAAPLQAAAAACPYGAIMFDTDANTTAWKCDMCIDQLTMQKLPVCVLGCTMRALDFGPMSYLQSTYGTNADLPQVPSSSTTKPAVVFKAHDANTTQVVPYDVPTALSLMGSRGSLPPIYTSTTGITNIPAGTVGRSQLNMKATGADLIAATSDDDG